jgi:SAM-dependent methyltransferase
MTLDARAFTAFERAAHDRIASPYAKHFAPLTTLALEPLLDGARIAAGWRVLDVATGPGVAAAVAQSRGAEVVGVDVSPGMVAQAREAHSSIDFRIAEVTALPFAEGAFDAVVCNFGLGHFPEPEAALAECMRVLAPGGTLAFSWWDQPARQRVQGLFREVIAELTLPPPPELPQGHDTLRFSDLEVFADLLRGVGLAEVAVAPHRGIHLMPDVEALWRAGMGGLAVTAGAITSQDAVTQARAREVLAQRAETYRSLRGLEIPIAYLVGTGRKPPGG